MGTQDHLSVINNNELKATYGGLSITASLIRYATQALKEKLENKKIQTILIILSFPLLVQVMYYVYKMGMIYGTIIRKLLCM